MGQEFTIKSQDIEDKINQLLPTQGGFQPGVDFSASTMVVPIVDLTETAEGSTLRQDLQTSLSFNTITAFNVSNTQTTLINTTGYFRVFGSAGGGTSAGTGAIARIKINDGVSTKNVVDYEFINTANQMSPSYIFDFVVFMEAGHSLLAETDSSVVTISGSTRQIADLQGNLVNP